MQIQITNDSGMNATIDSGGGNMKVEISGEIFLVRDEARLVMFSSMQDAYDYIQACKTTDV